MKKANFKKLTQSIRPLSKPPSALNPSLAARIIQNFISVSDRYANKILNNSNSPITRFRIKGGFGKRSIVIAQLLFTASSLLFVPSAYAQSIQPTGQTNTLTRNPQTIGSSNLGAPVTPLQGSTGPQVLGVSINQFKAGSLKVDAPKSPSLIASPTSYDDPLAAPTQKPDGSNSIFLKFVVPVAGGLTLLLGLLAIVQASKKRNIDLS